MPIYFDGDLIELFPSYSTGNGVCPLGSHHDQEKHFHSLKKLLEGYVCVCVCAHAVSLKKNSFSSPINLVSLDNAVGRNT